METKLFIPNMRNVECPYCPIKLYVYADQANRSGFQIVQCPEDEGGCGRDFIVKMEYTLTTRVYTLGSEVKDD